MQRRILYPLGSLTWLIPAWIAVLFLYGCEDQRVSSVDPGSGNSAEVGRGPAGQDGNPTLPAATAIDARPVAIVNGRQVTWGELRPSLTESAGATALQELVLDRALQGRLAATGKTIDGSAIEAERRLLLSSLSEDAEVAQRLLNALRRRQGLGPRRFDGLLRRNAQLRALVRDDVQITEEQIARRYEIVYGARRQARLITTPDLGTAQGVVEDLRAGAAFDGLAVSLSTDQSAARGGLLEPIARQDPAYPEALRRVLWTLEEGEISNPILIGDQYAILRYERSTDASTEKLEDVRPFLVRQIRIEQERVMMDEQALRLIRESSIKIYDADLSAAWQRSMVSRSS